MEFDKCISAIKENAFVASQYPVIITLEDNLTSKLQKKACRNPTLAKCGGEAQHLEKVKIWSPPGLPNV